MGFTLFSIPLGIFAGLSAGFLLTLGVRFPLLTVLLEKDKGAANERKDAAKGLCFGVAVLFAVTAFFIAVYSAYFVASGIRTEGVISELREKKDKDGFVSSTPFYRYSDKNGGIHLSDSNFRDGTEYKIGDKVPVVYLPESPSDSRVDYFPNHWLGPIFIFAFSLGIGLVPTVSSRILKRKAAKS